MLLDFVSRTTDSLITLCHSPVTVCLALGFYVFMGEKVFETIRDRLDIRPNSVGLKSFVLAHNIVLVAFSAIVFVNVLPIWKNYLTANGFRGLHCNADFWKESTDLWYWANVFYVSKYYEFIDSWILVLKGKKPSFLQVYHHTGIVVCMYLGCSTGSNWLVWVTLLNSFVHSLMYTYYAAATLGYRSSYAKYLTQAQMAQFIVGCLVSSSIYWFKECRPTVKYGPLFITHSYAVGLIVLFGHMYKNKYKKDDKDGPGRDEQGKGVNEIGDSEANKMGIDLNVSHMKSNLSNTKKESMVNRQDNRRVEVSGG
eukprot:GHVN01070995.1.p1 GENE.GHVN01070995.1~~GHVN01070995.1.p1  ORF type:complete len:311 (+),score=39.84 GHVN01070995.1:108-1040(+)